MKFWNKFNHKLPHTVEQTLSDSSEVDLSEFNRNLVIKTFPVGTEFFYLGRKMIVCSAVISYDKIWGDQLYILCEYIVDVGVIREWKCGDNMIPILLNIEKYSSAT